MNNLSQNQISFIAQNDISEVDLSVVIPIYNEVDSLTKLVEAIQEALQSNSLIYEII